MIVAVWSTPAASQSVYDRPIQPPAEVVEERLQELREQVKSAYRDGRYHDALGALEEAWAFRQTGDIAANLARVELTLGMYLEAAEHYRYALDHALPETTEQQREAMRADLAEAKAHVGTLVLAVSSPTAVVSIGGRALLADELQTEIYVPPGTIEISAIDSWGERAHWRGEVAAGSEYSITLELKPSLPPPSPERRPESAPTTRPDHLERRSELDARIATTGTVFTVLSFGAALFFGAEAAADDVRRRRLRAQLPPGDSICSRGTPYLMECAELRDAADQASLYRGMRDGSFIAAAAFGAATLGYLVWPRGGSGAAAKVSLAPGPGYVTVVGTW